MNAVAKAFESARYAVVFLAGYLTADTGAPVWQGALWCLLALLVLAALEGFTEGIVSGIRRKAEREP